MCKTFRLRLETIYYSLRGDNLKYFNKNFNSWCFLLSKFI